MADSTGQPSQGFLLPVDFAMGGLAEGKGLLQPLQVRGAAEALVARRAAGEQLDLATVFVDQGLLSAEVAAQIRQVAQAHVAQQAAQQAAAPAPATQPGPGAPAPPPPAGGVAPPPPAPLPQAPPLPAAAQAPSTSPGAAPSAPAVEGAPGPQSGTSPRRLAASGRTSRRRAMREEEGLPVQAKVGAAVGVLLFALIGGAVLFSGKDPQESAAASPTASASATPAGTNSPGASPGAQAPSPTPTPQASLSPRAKARVEIYALESKGDYRGALAKLEALPEKLRGPAFDSKRARLKRFAEYAETLAEALKEGPKGSKFRRWVERIEDESVEEDLAALPATASFTAKARELAGEDYAAIAAGEFEEEEEDDDEEMPWEVEREIEQLGGEERRARMKAEAAKAAERVVAARRALEARDAQRKQDLAKEEERAKSKCAKLSIPLGKGRDATGRLVSYGERGFTVSVDGAQRRFSWLGGPPQLVCQVLEAALRPKSVSDQRRLLRLACLRGQSDVAKRARDRIKRIEPKASLPDPELFKSLARVLQVGTLTETKLQANYRFQSELEDYDFYAFPGAESEVKGKRLRVLAKLPGLLPALVVHDASLRGDATFVIQADPGAKGRLVILVGGRYLVADSQGLASTDDIGAVMELKLEGPGLDLGQAFLIELSYAKESATLRLKQGGKVRFEGAADKDPEHIIGVGGTGALTRISRLELRAKPDAAWVKAARARLPFDCELYYQAYEWSEAPDEPDLGLVYSKTSAEDPECLKDLPPIALKQLAAARSVLVAAGESYAAGPLRQAINACGGRGFWAAEYLLARLEMDAAEHATSLGGARIRLDQAIEGIDGFYEAYTARSELMLEIGALELARADAERALELRPDYAPAHSALAYVLLQEGKPQEAMAEIRLARELSGRIKWVLQEDRLSAALDGPLFWNDFSRIETPHYILTTDLVDRREEFEKVLRRFRDLAPTIFPSLKPREGSQERRARVYVFSEQEGYRRYCYQIFFDRKESSAGIFSPQTGNLQIDASARDAVSTLQHELTHQWVHSMGLELPYWLNEAVADYVGEYDPETKTSGMDLDALESLAETEESPYELFDLMTLSPAEFYSGDTYLNYCLAWSFVHFCMEGGKPKLKQALFDYLAEHNKGPAGDAKRQAGTGLEHTYASTFHQLDMKSIQVEWWAYVKALCKKHLPKKKGEEGK